MCSDINYIIRMSLNGDKIYQEILLQKLNPLIYKNIYRYWMPNDLIIEDLVQEGYALILESLKNYDEKRNAHFLYYVKINLIYFYKNYHRKANRQNIKNIPDENLSGKTTKSILDNLIEKEEADKLLFNVNKLSVKEQKILYLYYYEEQSMSEISKVLNTPYRTVLGKKYAAIKKLKKLMNSRR